jgi:Zn-dependent protease/CBS domain-containing protein
MTTIKLFTVQGIEVKMHITFPLILVLAAAQFGYLNEKAFSLSGAVFGTVITLLLFVCVVIHELAHSLTSTRLGFPVRDIVLLPLGGVSQIERMPEGPAQEFLLAIAGPMSNVIIASVLIAVGLLLGMNINLRLDVANLGWKDTFPYLIVTNLWLAAFNLIPAFPMDGGRVLRALLASVMPYARATALAARIGQSLSWGLGLIGLLINNPLWILIAIFVYFGATQEGRMAQIRSVLQDLRVRQAFSRDVLFLSPDDPVSRAADLTLERFQADFPVCEEGCLVGLLTHADVIRALKQRQPEASVRTVMQKEFPILGLTDGLFEAHRQMTKAGLDALPVMEGEQFLGLLTRRDVSEVYQLLSVSQDYRGKG